MILIIGSNGQLGREMQRTLTKRDVAFKACDYPEIDIASPQSMGRLIVETKPDAVVNCAAYTNVDKAESDYDHAYQINALGPKNLAEACNLHGIELVHISTDYVFSGEAILERGAPRPYIESDIPGPVTVYGKTKLEGEKFVQSLHDQYYILRTAWLYGDGNNFVRTMLKLSEQLDNINVVNDQIGSPTSTVDLANVICSIINSRQYGLYHATCEGQCSWYDFTKKIFQLRGIDTSVAPVTSTEFVRPAKRPAWSVLENANLKKIQKNLFRNWEDSLREYLNV